MFYHEYSVKWMEILLQTLKDKNISNTIIVMDNAKYHKVLPDDVPRKSNKKVVLQDACQKYGIGYSMTDTKIMMWDKLRKYMQANISPVVAKMAEDAGHELLYSPPHYSDLQPTETVWAIIKGLSDGNIQQQLRLKMF